MKKSDSNRSLEETLEISSKSNLESREIEENVVSREDEQDEGSRLLRRSNSSESTKLETEEIPTTPPTPQKVKSRSRFSSAFRSLRGSSSGKKSLSPSTPTIRVEQVSGSPTPAAASTATLTEDADGGRPTKQNSLETEPPSPKGPKKKKSKLVKKFSLSGIKKQKVSPRKNSEQIPPASEPSPISLSPPPSRENLISSATQTPITALQRRSPEGGNLSLSQTSLANFPSGDDGESSPNPARIERVRKIQITISGKKVEHTQKLLPLISTEITGEEDYLAVVASPAELSSKKRDIEVQKVVASAVDADSRREKAKINITKSTRDTPPRERAPPRPAQSPKDDRREKAKKQQESSATGSTAEETTSKGAVRKAAGAGKLKRQKSRDDPAPPIEVEAEAESLMRRDTGSIERGRRFPRPVTPVETEKPPETIEAPSQGLSPQLEQQQEQKEREQERPDTEQLQQDLNTSASPKSGNSVKNPNLGGFTDESLEVYRSSEEDDDSLGVRFAVGNIVSRQSTVIYGRFADSREQTSIGSNRSSGSQSPVSEGRRKIRYIDQATFYTDEERDILEGRREVYRQLSEISEYSLDSDFSGDTHMPAFGDLTMDHEEPPIMTTSANEKREHLYKILVIGELGTGKTSFIKRYVHQFFSQNYRATIGVDFALKVLHWDQNTIIRLQLWDIAGQERFGNMTRVYYKEAVGAFIVFDVTRSATFDAVIKWKQDLDSKVQLPDGSPIPCILLANKCDQQKQGIVTTPAKMDEYVKENGFSGWYETSAKENINIEDAARALVNKILLNDKLISAGDMSDSDKFILPGSGGSAASVPPKKTCSC